MLREMLEYKINYERLRRGDLEMSEIQNLILRTFEDIEKDYLPGNHYSFWHVSYICLSLLSEIHELRKQVMQSARRNYLLEHELKKLEKKIGLLIANRTSIQVSQNRSTTYLSCLFSLVNIDKTLSLLFICLKWNY